MWRLTTLGGLALVPLDRPAPGRPASADTGDAPALRRPLALLAVLAAAGDRGVPRDRLLLFFWPESDTEHARNSLKQTLFRLRRELAAPELVLGTGELRLNPAVVTSDVGDFDRTLAAGDLEAAVALYRGPFLHGAASGRLPELDEWAAAERARLAARFAAAVESLAAAAEARGDHHAAVGWWRRLAVAEPASSRVALGLLGALDAAGDRDGALQCFRLHELLLREELGVEPEESVVALVERLRAGGRPTPAAGEPVAPPPPVAEAPPDPPLAPGSEHRATGSQPRRRLLVGATAALAALALLAGWFTWRGRDVARAGTVDGSRSVVVLPFAVRAGTGAAGAEHWLGEGMVELLSRNLDGAGALRAADPHVVVGLARRARPGGATDPALGGSVARRLDADYVVLGEIAAAGGRLRVAASLYEPAADSLRLVGLAEAEGDSSQLFAIVDQLALRLLAALPRSGVERLERTAALTTSSLAALKAYLDGEALLRDGRWTEALEAFRAAVAEDSAFALAHFRLAVAADWAGRGELVLPAAERAYRASARLGAHDSLLVHAHHAFRRHESAEAERIYRQIVGTWPDDVEAWYQLGELAFHRNAERGRPLGEAREPFARVLRLDPVNEEARLHLVRVAAREGRRAEVDSLVRDVLGRMPPHRGLELRAFRALTLGSRAEGEAALDELRRGTEADRYVTAWRVAVYGRELDAAARVAAIMAEPHQEPNARANGHELRAGIHLAQGRPRAADTELAAIARLPGHARYALSLRALHAAVPAASRPRAELAALLAELRAVEAADRDAYVPTPAVPDPLVLVHAVGIVSAAAGDTTAALGAARRLRAAASDSTTRARLAHALADGIAAQVALRAGRPDDAVALLRPIAGSRVTAETHLEALDRFVLADALAAAGHDDEALGWYASIADVSWQNVLFLGVAELRQARLHDRRGDRARAVAHYRRVVALWRECEAEQRAVREDAERRIAELGKG